MEVPTGTREEETGEEAMLMDLGLSGDRDNCKCAIINNKRCGLKYNNNNNNNNELYNTCREVLTDYHQVLV